MIFNEQNITNRTIIARCCFADLVFEMLEAGAIGDNEAYQCKRKKALLLSYAIEQMCEYVSDGVFTLNQDDDTEVSCFTNDTAKKFLGQMDELCGCPCGCSDAKILDDNLPKYI